MVTPHAYLLTLTLHEVCDLATGERFRWQYSLEAWLEIATARLCAEAAERVRREILEHYQAAFDEERAAGKTARRANKTVLAQLGNPYQASHSLRGIFLTEYEMKFLNISSRPHSIKSLSTFDIWYIVVVVAICFIYPLLARTHLNSIAQYLWFSVGTALAEFVLYLMAGFLGDWLPSRAASQNRPLIVTALEQVYALLAYLLFFVLMVQSLRIFNALFLPGMLGTSFLLIYRAWRIRQKLQQLPRIENS